MKHLKAILLCIISFSFFSHIQAQTIPLALDTLLNKTLDSMQIVLNVKSLSAAIQFSDTDNWARATGISSMNPTVNVTTNDAYLIGSVTKTLTSACILQLADQNLLNVDDSLYKWLDTMPYINPNITIRQLLRHQSGLYDVLENSNCQPTLMAKQDSVWKAQDLISTFVQAPHFQAGAGWSYCNTNYMLLGMIIEKVTGNPFYEELRSRFFMPLGLNSIAIPAFETVNSPIAHVWLDITGDNITDDAHNFYFNYLSLNSTAGAAGGYYATPSDISKWMRTYMRGDLHSANIMAQAKTTVSAPGLPNTTYGLGLMKKSFYSYDGYGHGGDLAYAASSWYFPAKDISISVFTNDSKNNSWTLAPVVAALLKTFFTWQNTSGIVSDSRVEDIGTSVFPNPFNDEITIALQLPQNVSEIQLELSNILGQKLATITEQNLSAGDAYLTFPHLTHLHSGVYFVNISQNGHWIKTLKVVK